MIDDGRARDVGQTAHCGSRSGPGGCEAKKRVAYPPPDSSEIEQCNPLYAYERRGADIYQPFQVPNGGNYARFAFDVPWSGAAQALSVRIRACELPAHQATDIKARCTPKYTPDTHLIKTYPHMHARGVQLNGSVDDGGVGCFE